MGIKQERENFISRIAFECATGKGALWRDYGNPNLALDLARKFLRLSQTHGRLCCAYCNGDWPYNGPWNTATGKTSTNRVITRYEHGQCADCMADVISTTINKAGVCKKCRIEAQLKTLAESAGIQLKLQQDPRGWTVRLVINGNEIGVPQYDN